MAMNRSSGAVVCNFADLFQILGDVGDQIASFMIVKIAEAELLNVVKGLATHICLDGNAQGVAPIVHDTHQPGIDRVDKQEQRRGAKN